MSTKVLLKDLIKEDRRITYGVVKPGPEDESGVTLVRGGDIKAGKVQLDGLRTITEEVSRSYRRTLLRGGELLISLVGNPGEVAIASDTLKDANIARQVGLIPLDKSVNSKYVMYYLMSPQGRSQLFMRTQGAVQQVINLADIKKVPIRIITRKDQDRIASILSAYDDLIENNRRRIALLEEAARQLYKEWFVRFRYPGHEHVPIVDGVPEGWEKKKLFDLSTLTYGFAFKSTAFTEKEVGLPIVRIRDVPNGASATYTPEESSEDKIIYDGDFLIGMDGDFHINFWSGGKSWLNQRVVRIAGRTDCSTGFLRYAIEKKIQDFNETISGTTVKHLGVKHLKTITLVLPPKALMNQTNAVFETTRQQITTLAIQSRALGRARGLLLPKLMNGEIVV